MSNGSRRNRYNELMRTGPVGRSVPSVVFDFLYPLCVAVVFVEVSRQTGVMHADQIQWTHILPGSW